MIELIIVRHGETDSGKQGRYCGWTDAELNEEGLRQTHALCRRLDGQHIDAIYCSTLKRAVNTAEIINERLRLNIVSSDALREKNFGIWDNLTWQEIVKAYPLEYDEWCSNWLGFTVMGGESALEAHNRVTGFIDELLEKSGSGVFLLVTHQGVIRSLLVHLLHMQLEDVWRFKLDNGSITRVEIDDKGYAYLTQLNA